MIVGYVIREHIGGVSVIMCVCGIINLQLKTDFYLATDDSCKFIAKAVTISTSNTIKYLFVVFASYSENLNIVLLTRLIAQLPTLFVVCGDFNGHIMTWGCDKNNGQEID